MLLRPALIALHPLGRPKPHATWSGASHSGATTLLPFNPRPLRCCQTCVRPARDIFTSLSGLVASLVVVPLVSATGDALGGLYFALDRPCEFVNNQDTLLVRGGV